MIQLVFIGYILAVIYLSLTPNAALGVGMPTDKPAHFIAYGVMGVLAYLSVESKEKRAYLFVFVVILGVVLEFLQFYIPGRSASFFDMIANTIGAFIGYLIGWFTITRIFTYFNLDKEPFQILRIKGIATISKKRLKRLYYQLLLKEVNYGHTILRSCTDCYR